MIQTRSSVPNLVSKPVHSKTYPGKLPYNLFSCRASQVAVVRAEEEKKEGGWGQMDIGHCRMFFVPTHKIKKKVVKLLFG